jgi:hypothetical protein
MSNGTSSAEWERAEKFSFFARLSEVVRASADVSIVLVGGSAVEWHFPDLGASMDLDVIVQALSSGPRRAFERVLLDEGWTREGKAFVSEKYVFSIDVVGSVLDMGVALQDGDVSLCEAPSGLAFRVYSPTMMWCDRLMAWEALPASDRDASASLKILKKYRSKLNVARAQEVLAGNGVLENLRRRVSGRPEWEGLRHVFEKGVR